ncbi:Translation machinery-associated protein 46, partial [Coemansia sp. RSA 486]
RHKLGSNQTPVTLESFTKWKIERKARKEAEEQEARQAKERAFKAGKMGNMSGRDFFEFNPEIQNAGDDNDDDGTFDFAQYRNTDGGYQQDSQYTDQQGEAQGETQAASESLGDLKISDDKA